MDPGFHRDDNIVAVLNEAGRVRSERARGLVIHLFRQPRGLTPGDLGPAYAGWNTSVRSSMLSRGKASGGVVGSVNEVCGMKRAEMSVLVSAIFSSSTSSRRISGV